MLELSVAQRIEALLDHLSLDKVHLGACMSADWGGVIESLPDRIATLTVVAPHLNKGVPEATATFTTPTMVIAGDEGPTAARARALTEVFPNGEFVGLSGYTSAIWADTVADRINEVKSSLIEFLRRAEVAAGGTLEPARLQASDGTHEGLRYRIEGQGPPLLLLPLSMSPSQWDPLIEQLKDSFCVIGLGGALLGAVALLEGRAASGYGELVTSVLSAARLGPEQVSLEVGCGSGALSRLLLAQSDPTSRAVATDLNPYFLMEAQALADDAQMMSRVRFEKANAEHLPHGDDSFDTAMSCTVMEEGDAGQMLSELVRVTKPGGRIVILTRALDVDWWINIGLSQDLRRRLNAHGPNTGSGVGAKGCADSGIYHRVLNAGVNPLLMGPQFANYRDGERREDVLARLVSALSGEEKEAFHKAVDVARSDGTLIVAEPFHCVVGEVR